MKKYFIRTSLILFYLLICIPSIAQYQQDILGNGFEQRVIQMPVDEDGNVICTIIRKKTDQPTNKAVLYIHGFCDYFFNKELAEACTKNGIDFYAIDLRKYGRSIQKHDSANRCRNLKEYFPDIDTALSIIKNEGHSDISINAHSTGGLTTLLYAKEHQSNKKYTKIILNSPFLSMNQSWFKENILIPFVSFLGRFFPTLGLPKGLSGLYGETISKNYRGEWEYNETWKPIIAFRMDAGWLRAIHLGHNEIEDGLNLNDDITVMCSDKTIRDETWSEAFRTADAVLDAEEIKTIGKSLGKNAKVVVIKDGMHDLALSIKPVREEYFKQFIQILK